MPEKLSEMVKAAEKESTTERILIIDDHPESARLLKTLLDEHAHYRVFTAPGGQQGVSMVARRRPDLVILDLRMPDMDGFAVLQELRKEAKKRFVLRVRQHPDYRILSGLPGFGPVHVGQLIATVGTPHRFRTKRQFWPYCGLSVVTRSSADYRIVEGKIVKSQKKVGTRGLNRNHNPRLKQVFKSAALTSLCYEECLAYYQRLVKGGTRPELARVSVARKLAAAALAIWQRKEKYDPQKFFA